MSTSDKWLGKGSTDPGEVAEYYDKWASTYNNSLEEWEYRAPQHAAEMQRKYAQLKGPVFDAGCGTGLTGLALRKEGFENLIGTDISAASVEEAARVGVYDDVSVLDLQEFPLPFGDNHFASVNCVGVLTYIEERAKLLREFIRVTAPQGMIIFTHRSDLIEKQNFHQSLDALEDENLWQQVHISEPQPYLPKNEEFGDKILVVYFAYRVPKR